MKTRPEDRTTLIGFRDKKTLAHVGDKVWTYDGRYIVITHISESGQVASSKSGKVNSGSYSSGSAYTSDPNECIEAQLRTIESRRRSVAAAETELAKAMEDLAAMEARIIEVQARAEVESAAPLP